MPFMLYDKCTVSIIIIIIYLFFYPQKKIPEGGQKIINS